ncbi:DUF6777 domain-containing protein [Streptomyces sp. NBC_00094]|uniref:DUF6777 domain-containing protein n=1 Tax=Streptomyces sp. NBC_00094 TaxID=2903620 RepID=UPI00225531B1|nr:DUF6777 domain-containing protein [Streptomyces sp. NBC_00094]MCX5394618.1 hypothetical protein [Streptomyces sp. NBC_00094]
MLTGPAAITAITALASTLLVAGCSSGGEGGSHGEQPEAATAQEVFLQPVAARGPDPFTPSTARIAAPATPVVRDPGAASVQQIREVTGSTPGLYGGTRAEASCDVEQQAAFLAADPGRTRAFAEAAGIPEGNVPGWLRGLTPVVLRADTRVTNHGYRDGGATAFQSVLQTGTAVLVDQYGSPRVRCACGNPLRTPVSVQGGIHQGDPWDGFDPEHVIVVRPTSTVVTSLVIVNAADRTWIERRTGSDGAEDRKPVVEPSCDPDACHLTEAATPDPARPDPARPDPTRPDPVRPAPATPDLSTPVPTDPAPVIPDPSGSGGTGTDPSPAYPDASGEPYPDPYEEPTSEPFPDPSMDPYADPDADPHADPYADPYAEPPVEPPVEPPTAPEGGLPPEEFFPPDTGPEQPETFEG